MRWRIPAILLILQLCIPANNLHSQSTELDVSLKTSLDRSEVRVGQSVRMEVTVQWSGSPSDYEIGTTSSPALLGLRMVSSESRVSARAEPEAPVTRIMVYEMEAVEEGKAKIGAVELSVRDVKSDKLSALSTEPLDVNVLPAPAPLISFPENSRRYAIGAGLILFALLMAVAAVVMLRKGKKKAQNDSDAQKQALTPEQVFDQKAGEASQMLFAGDFKSYVKSLEDAIVEWIECRLEITRDNWPDKTEAQIREKELIPASHAEHIRMFVKKCEAVKFGGERPKREDMDNILECLKTVVHGGTGARVEASKKTD